MSDVVPFVKWGELDFTTITDKQYCEVIEGILQNFNEYSDDPRLKEAPAPKPDDVPETFDDYFYVIFKSRQGEVWGLYHKRDQYLFAVKPIRGWGPVRTKPQPFESVRGFSFRLPYDDIKEVAADLNVTYKSLQGSSSPSYTLSQMSNAVTTLARGSAGNKFWGPALATLIGVTSDAIKSIGMKHHISFGLNVKSDVPHVPSNRLMKINNCWSKISKSTRSKKFDFVLEYENENGVKIKEAVTEYSVGLIFAIINNKDGSKAEKFTRKLQKKDHQGKRKSDDDQEYRGKREMWSGKSSEQPKGNKAPQSSGGKYQRSAPQSSGGKYQKSALGYDSSDSASDSEATGEEKSEIQTEKFEDSVPFDDDNNEPEVIPIIMHPCKGHFSDDSSTDSPYFCDSDETIAEEESKINKESSPKDKDREKQLKSPSNASPQDNQTPSEPIEERPNMEFDPKSSTTESASSILVKHGTKRPIEAEVGDEESKRAKKLALSKSTIENVQN